MTKEKDKAALIVLARQYTLELWPVWAAFLTVAFSFGVIAFCVSLAPAAHASPDTFTRSDLDRVVRALEAQTDATRDLTRAVRELKP